MIFEKSLRQRKPNIFEKVLLFTGVIVMAAGYFLVHNIIVNYGFTSYEAAVCLLLWFILIIMFILTAVNENSKEELKIIIKQQADEISLLRNDLRRKK